MLYQDSNGDYWLLRTDFGDGSAKMYAADKEGRKLGEAVFSHKLSRMTKIG